MPRGDVRELVLSDDAVLLQHVLQRLLLPCRIHELLSEQLRGWDVLPDWHRCAYSVRCGFLRIVVAGAAIYAELLRGVPRGLLLRAGLHDPDAVHGLDVPTGLLLRARERAAGAAVPSGELWEPDGPHERGVRRALRGGVLLRSGEHLGNAVHGG